MLQERGARFPFLTDSTFQYRLGPLTGRPPGTSGGRTDHFLDGLLAPFGCRPILAGTEKTGTEPRGVRHRGPSDRMLASYRRPFRPPMSSSAMRPLWRPRLHVATLPPPRSVRRGFRDPGGDPGPGRGAPQGGFFSCAQGSGSIPIRGVRCGPREGRLQASDDLLDPRYYISPAFGEGNWNGGEEPCRGAAVKLGRGGRRGRNGLRRLPSPPARDGGDRCWST
jgi:hypothetical protein